eukprot:Nitzschia sp. Nitz4//scaffold114_size70088//15314//16997//NITZ4_005971-RA/size70088-snap-gene-0.2-mRNA-1//1//CDS//3329533405//2635//frame0
MDNYDLEDTGRSRGSYRPVSAFSIEPGFADEPLYDEKRSSKGRCRWGLWITVLIMVTGVGYFAYSQAQSKAPVVTSSNQNVAQSASDDATSNAWPQSEEGEEHHAGENHNGEHGRDHDGEHEGGHDGNHPGKHSGNHARPSQNNGRPGGEGSWSHFAHNGFPNKGGTTTETAAPTSAPKSTTSSEGGMMSGMGMMDGGMMDDMGDNQTAGSMEDMMDNNDMDETNTTTSTQGVVDTSGTTNIPGDSVAEMAFCDGILTEEEEEWLDANVTLEDGAMYEVLEQLEHDPTAFLQGLTYFNGTLWESDGQYGESTVRILNESTGEVIQKVNMEASVFGEGMAYKDGKLYQITWTSKRGFIYDAATLEMEQEFLFYTTTGEGWGITYDPCQDQFVVTDGSNKLHFWDPETLEQTGTVPVYRQSGVAADKLNEIEWYRGKILANVWFEDVILVIDPESGVVEKEYDFRALYPKSERKGKGRGNVFNGISVSGDPSVLYVTGKLWDRMFKLRLLA